MMPKYANVHEALAAFDWDAVEEILAEETERHQAQQLGRWRLRIQNQLIPNRYHEALMLALQAERAHPGILSETQAKITEQKKKYDAILGASK